MAKNKKVKAVSSGSEPAMPCQADLHGVAHKGFNKFEEVALRAMTGMLANPGVLQLGLKPAEINEMVTTASLQIAEAMITKFDCLHASH